MRLQSAERSSRSRFSNRPLDQSAPVWPHSFIRKTTCVAYSENENTIKYVQYTIDYQTVRKLYNIIVLSDSRRARAAPMSACAAAVYGFHADKEARTIFWPVATKSHLQPKTTPSTSWNAFLTPRRVLVTTIWTLAFTRSLSLSVLLLLISFVFFVPTLSRYECTSAASSSPQYRNHRFYNTDFI